MKIVSMVLLVAAACAFGVALIFRYEIEDVLACWAYYDQCTAERVEGITSEECFSRDDSVSYLVNEKVCLVRPVNGG
ncbi:MAG: hypothetical protein ACRBDL_00460 [Alphaproteobacteria bacterium]